jgi:hypothetical protein
MNLEYCELIDAAEYLNTTTHELSDSDIKRVLLNIIVQIRRLEAENQKNIKALADASRE